MTRESWKDLFEAVGVVAVIASLVFVGMETRNNADQAAINTRAIEIASYQELINNIVAANLMMIGDTDIVDVQIRAANDPDSLSETERRKYGIWVLSGLRRADIAYFQYERGVIDEYRLKSVLGPLNTTFRNQLARNIWEQSQGNFVDSFRRYMNEHISLIPLGNSPAQQLAE